MILSLSRISVGQKRLLPVSMLQNFRRLSGGLKLTLANASFRAPERNEETDPAFRKVDQIVEAMVFDAKGWEHEDNESTDEIVARIVKECEHV